MLVKSIAECLMQVKSIAECLMQVKSIAECLMQVESIAECSCRSKVLQNAPREHSAILSTCIKLPPVFKTIILSMFEWQLKTGLTVQS